MRYFPKKFRLAITFLFDFDHVYKEKTQNFFARDYPFPDLAPPLGTFWLRPCTHIQYTYVHEVEMILEQFFLCKELEGKTTGKYVFATMDGYLQSHDLSWSNCVGICTDGALSMRGPVKGFVTLAKNVNDDIITTHCFFAPGSFGGKNTSSRAEKCFG